MTEHANVITERGYRRARLIMRLGDWGVTHRRSGTVELHSITHLPTGAQVAPLTKPDMLATDALMDALQLFDERVPAFDAQTMDGAMQSVKAALKELGL